MKDFITRLRDGVLKEGSWWQVPLLMVLILGVLLILYVAQTQQTEFIYALF